MASTAALCGSMMSSSFLRVRRQTRLKAFPNASAVFGVKGGRGGRVTAMASYKVKLITPEGEVEFECPDDVYILEQAEEEGVELPFSCKAGSCSVCTGKVVSGTVDNSEAAFLEDEQIEAGFTLTCVAKPTSNVVIETHKENDLP